MSDTPRDFTITLAAGIAGKIEARGRFFGIIEAPAGPLDVQFEGSAPLRRGAGGSILLPRFFTRVTLTSTAAQTVRVLVSDEAQDVSNIVAGSGGGGATTQEEPAAAVADTAPVVVATAAEAVLFAANSARRRLSVFVDSLNTGSCFVRPAGASVNNIGELQPGLVYEFKGRYGLDVRNDTGANATFYIFEET